jgi:hypothetical protein
LKCSGHVISGFKDEESLSSIAQLHGKVLFDPVDGKLNLLLRRSKERELAEADVERRARKAAYSQVRDSLHDLINRLAGNRPSSCSITITSMAPLRVAGLIEFQVLETGPLRLRTYCIPTLERGQNGLCMY